MKRQRWLLLVFNMLFLGHLLCAQGIQEDYKHLLTPVRSYVVYQSKTPLIIDGRADETDWNKVPWTEDFEDIEGDKKPKPLHRTRVKMLYDKLGLYLLAELEEPHIWAIYEGHDMIIYHENDIEVFIDPDGDTHHYFEYEVNAKNTLLDLKMPMPYRNGGHADIKWNSKGFQSAVSIDGTLNDPRDTDNKWTVEMKFPFSNLEVQQMPADGQIWKVNFSRVEWRTQVVNGIYQKVKDPSTNRPYPEYNWVWSPPGLVNMHYPERWGMIQFSAKEAGSEPDHFKMPEGEAVSKYLWLIYYKQQDFKRKNSRYANSLKELDVPQDQVSEALKMKLTATPQQFTIKATINGGAILSINETGLFLTKNTDQ